MRLKWPQNATIFEAIFPWFQFPFPEILCKKWIIIKCGCAGSSITLLSLAKTMLAGKSDLDIFTYIDLVLLKTMTINLMMENNEESMFRQLSFFVPAICSGNNFPAIFIFCYKKANFLKHL
jgi:hypothetical protein